MTLSVINLTCTKSGDSSPPYAPQQHLYASVSPSHLIPTTLLLNGDAHRHTTNEHQYYLITGTLIQHQKYPILLGLHHPPFFLLLRLLHRLRRYLIPILIQFLYNWNESRGSAHKRSTAPLVGRLAPIFLIVADVKKCGARDLAGWSAVSAMCVAQEFRSRTKFFFYFELCNSIFFCFRSMGATAPPE